jgi:hypothetical protein
MTAKLAALISIFLAGSFVGIPASATDYQLFSLPLSYRFGATSATGSLTTDFRGTLTDEAAIETFLNSASYSAVLYAGSEAVTHLDNSNARWDLTFSLGSGLTALLDVRDTGIFLSFTTPTDPTGVNLLLRSFDGLSVLQYRQDNNVRDTTVVDFGFNALYGAGYSLPYGSMITLSVAPVPEPEILSSLALGLFLIGRATRKRRRATGQERKLAAGTLARR